MNQEPPPPSATAFDLNEVARLNEEVRQLRESVKRKRLAREAAKRQGKRAVVDLGPELLRLNRLIEDLDQLRERLKSSAIPKTDREASGAEALRNVLLEMKNQLVKEKDRLAEENAAEQSQEQLKREADEIRTLREELAKDKETLEKEKESLELVLSQAKEQQAQLKSMAVETHPEISAQTRLKAAYDYQKAEDLDDRKLEFLIDQLSVIKTELRDVKEHLAKEERILERKQRELDEERYAIREEKRLPETMLTREIATMKLELEKLREQLAKEQEIVESRRNELAEEREKIDEERKALENPETTVTREIATMKLELEKLREQLAKEQEIVESRRNELAGEKEKIDGERKALEMRIAEAQDDFAKRTIQRIRNELQSERIELGSLRKSINQIKATNLRERKIIERDRDAILRVQVKLEREKQRIAHRAALLEFRERRARTTGTHRRVKPREIRKRRDPGTGQGGARTGTEDHETFEQVGQGGPIQGEGVILGVKLGKEDYGIDTTRVREIIRMREITPLPRQPPYVEGVMNVRGAIIPVVNLKKRFGLQENGSKHPHIVIVESAKGLVGILVDSVTEVIRVPTQQISPPPQVTKGIDGEYLHGICRLGEKLMIYLDLEKLLEQGVPVDRTAELQLLLARRSEVSELNKDEEKIINAIPKAGRTKQSLRRKVRFSAGKLDRLISSLLHKELIEVTHVGNSKLIRRTNA